MALKEDFGTKTSADKRDTDTRGQGFNPDAQNGQYTGQTNANGGVDPEQFSSGNRLAMVQDLALILRENREEATEVLNHARRAMDRDAEAVALVLGALESRDYFWKRVKAKRRQFQLESVTIEFDRAMGCEGSKLSEFSEGLNAGSLLPSADEILSELKLLPS